MNMKMLAVFYFLLMLSEAGCTNDQIFETKIVAVGDEVEINCPRGGLGSLYWIRLDSEKSPEYLGKANSFPNQSRRFTIKEPKRGFVLHKTRAEVEDTGLYFCIKTYQQDLIFLKRINLTIEAEKPVQCTTAGPTADPVTPVQKTCPQEHSVCCLGAGSNQSHSGLNSTQGISINRTGSLTKKCNCTFFNTSCCDDGAYFCAVDECEEIKPESPGSPAQENTAVGSNSTVLNLLIAALVISLTVIAFLLYTVWNLRKQYCDCNKVGVALQSEVERAQSDQQADGDSLIYSAPAFIKRSSSRAGVKAVRQTEEESIYSDVRVHEGN